ncbi:caspase family protein [Kitasatospora purpeofusca]|uniref:caspase family protein n=1 Tax=Kitasatospora purpeofusca TaxID=67352 RepID=UPI0036B3722F
MSLPDAARSRAVLIGVDDFTYLTELPAVRNNLEALSALLTSSASWSLSSEHCTVIRNPSSAAEVVDAVTEAALEATDALLVYYAGHGLKDPYNGALCLSLVGSQSGAGYTAVYYDWVRREISRSPAALRIVILDCCFGASAFPAMADAGTSVADQAAVEGTYLISAAGATDEALAEDGEGYTAFTGEMLRLIEQGVPGGLPLLDLDTIFNRLVFEMRAKSRPLPQQRVSNSAGRLAIAYNAALYDPVKAENSAQELGDRSADEMTRASDFKAHGSGDGKQLAEGLTARPLSDAPVTLEIGPLPAGDEGDAEVVDVLRQTLETGRVRDPLALQGAAARVLVDFPQHRRSAVSALERILADRTHVSTHWRRVAEILVKLDPGYEEAAARALRAVIVAPTTDGVGERWAVESLRDLGTPYESEAAGYLRVMATDPAVYGLSEKQAEAALARPDAVDLDHSGAQDDLHGADRLHPPATSDRESQDPAQPEASDFSAFWFAVPAARPVYGEDGSLTPIAELVPGIWHLAVGQHGSALVVRTEDGRRGTLYDTTGIQRG